MDGSGEGGQGRDGAFRCVAPGRGQIFSGPPSVDHRSPAPSASIRPFDEPHRLHGFGLSFESAVPYGPLASGASPPPPDVRIVEGPTPERLDDPAVEGLRFQATEGRYLLKVDGVARYLVSGGDHVVVERAHGATDAEIWTAFLGAPLAALAHQRRLLPLSASAVEDGDGAATLVAGAHCSGRSTLASVLAHRGRQPLADRVAVLAPDGDRTTVKPGAAELHLTDAACRTLDLDPTAFPRSARGLARRSVPFRSRPEPFGRPVGRVILLRVEHRPDVRVGPIAGSEALGDLRRCLCRPELALGLAPAAQFQMLVSVLREASIVLVRRPAVGLTPGELADRLIAEGHA